MGKASRRRRERREDTSLSANSKKILREMIKESSPDVFVINGKKIYYNPLKKLLEGEPYKTDDGMAVSEEMVKKYNQFLKLRLQQEEIAKANNINLEDK